MPTELTAKRRAMPVFLLLLVGTTCCLHGEVLPAALFSDHAVLQQGMAVPVWGTARPGEKISVSFHEETEETQTDEAGRWLVKLKPLPAGVTDTLTIKGEASVVKASDVMTGETWLCSGQSNMGLKLDKVNNAAEEIAAADYPKIRVFFTRLNPQETPQTVCQGAWTVCTPAEARNYSAAAYFFGRDLFKELNVPVGLVVSAVGGTLVQSWMSAESLQKVSTYPEWLEFYKPFMARWSEPKPEIPSGLGLRGEWGVPQKLPSHLFNGMIAPLLPYAIRGAVWYQGESNTFHRPEWYSEYLSAMIADWRTRWGQDFPFCSVQMPNFGKPQVDPVQAETWPVIREEFLKTTKLPKTGMVVTIGLGDATNVHAPDKQGVGKRLAMWALANVYGKPEAGGTSPLPEKTEVQEDRIVVTFSHAEGGLVAPESGAKGFAIAGEDRKWRWADAKIEGGDRVIISSPDIKHPVAVRYAWANNPVFSLTNRAGLPASPFRTDDWPLRPYSQGNSARVVPADPE